MLRREPGLEVRVLARAVALSERQLRRRFHDAVGYGPKRLGRALRLQRLLAERRRRPRPPASSWRSRPASPTSRTWPARSARWPGRGAQAMLRERDRSVQAAALASGETG